MGSKYFTEREFKCAGVLCFDKMNKSLIDMLDVAREVAGVPFNITSSYRTEEHNVKIGGFKELSTPAWECSRYSCLLYTSPSPRDRTRSRMPSSA